MTIYIDEFITVEVDGVEKNYKKDDWICFISVGRPVIGRIQYFIHREITDDWIAWTNEGSVNLDDVLENRRYRERYENTR